MCLLRCLKTAALLLVFGVIAIAAQGCAQKPTEKPLEHTVRKVSAETSEELKQTKAEFEGVMKANLEKLEEEVRELKMKAGKLNQAARTKWNEEVAELDAKQKAARDKLDEVTRSTGEAWKSLRGGAKNAWEELEKAVQKARAAF